MSVFPLLVIYMNIHTITIVVVVVYQLNFNVRFIHSVFIHTFTCTRAAVMVQHAFSHCFIIYCDTNCTIGVYPCTQFHSFGGCS